MPSRAPLQRIRQTWFSNVRVDLLAGVVVALALIPEAISFSIIAGVDPKVGLYASFSIAIIIAFAGGRPAMISAATGAMALVVVSLVKEHGVEYLFVATILAGIIQVAFGALGVGRLMRFVPRTVMIGFVNALAILIFMAQLDHFIGISAAVYVMVALGIAIMVGLPRLTTAIPAPLVAIAVLGVGAAVLGVEVPTVGDMGDLPDSLPSFGLPGVPFTLETLTIIAPYAFTLAVVGLLESLLTAQLVDDITDTRSDKERESRGQGIANVATGFLGGMAGCAMIGQTMINVKAGARTRLSTLAAGVFLLVAILAFGDLVAAIPMAALVAVMILVAVGTFDWNSIKPAQLRRTPRTETAVMVVTVAITVATHNLALGVAGGVLLAAVFFARRVAHVADVTSVIDPADGRTRIYHVTGELFFASTNELLHLFDYTDDVDDVVIDLTDAHIWDTSAVAALDAVVAKLTAHGIDATLVGLNVHSAELHGRVTGHLTSSH
ncbi:SulP family inorganic anion transporter [Iamia majanohamensis]|uniref:SulP family inorganic anion transporter n=1 Tax=Iamia majanohamensis TaxID=467976 RepID=A0AAE9Y860_9ACTN|nr:SulP family inorganic anion transporter [Iamia majanohamensis]WCO66228.1 SulP family inorganic anion transporter [Iamia majanohamensis]